jgi:DNA ligase-1
VIKRPILAEKIEPSELENLKYPVLVSPKLDGIRCLIVDGKALSRSFKPIPNLFIQSLLSKQEFNGLDGELVLEGKTFNETQSIVCLKVQNLLILFTIVLITLEKMASITPSS